MSQKRKRSPEDRPSESKGSEIFRSDPIEDRSSTFIGFFSPSLKPKELQNLSEITGADHKILAWRRESNQQSISGAKKYVADHDDDGEKYGGKKVEKVLESMQVTGSCVVARWYGGVLLGPVRFTHMEACAKEAVQRWQESLAEERAKKQKVEQDAVEKTRLVKVLAERDQSIEVLRTLATEKEGQAKQAHAATIATNGDAEKTSKSSGASKAAAEVKPSIDYSAMSVDRLRALEKARDATISFLLKRIDKAEAELSKQNDGAGDGDSI